MQATGRLKGPGRTVSPWLVALLAGCAGSQSDPVTPGPGPVVVEVPVADGSGSNPVEVASSPGEATEVDKGPSGLEKLRLKHCAGMQPIDAPKGYTLPEGGTADQQISFEPNKCYTAIAWSRKITELDLSFVMMAPPMPQEMVVAQDQTSGSVAVIGPAPNCFKNPVPMAMPLTVRVKAAKGAGSVHVQLCKK